MEAELAGAFGSQVEVGLIAGSGGDFEVVGNGELIYSKRALGCFPKPGEVVELVRRNL